MKTLITAALIMSSSAVWAHDNSCDVDLTGGVTISPTSITFLQDKKPVYSISASHQLSVNDEIVSLSPSQQSLINEYESSIRQVVPEMRSIANDGIELATQGVTMAFGELLGENSDAVNNITTQLAKIKQQLNTRFADTETFTIDENGLNGEDFLGEEFEKELESTIENAIKSSIGSIMVAVGQQMIFSGGDSNAFEAKMEKFGDQIEHEMESKSTLLETRANQLCESIVVIDQLEAQLKTEIPQLSSYDFIKAKSNHHKKI